MESTVKITFSAISHIGAARELNSNRIYANGRFNDSFENDNLRIAMDASGNRLMFAVSDGMEIDDLETQTRISLASDFKKFAQRAKSNPKDIQTRAEELSETVSQTANLIKSLAFKNEDGTLIEPAFAGMFIENGRCAVLRMGNCSIFKLEDGMLKALASEKKRTERLVKMGILNDEQADFIKGQQDESKDDLANWCGRGEIHTLKEGDVFLICSNGLTSSVSEDTVSDIVNSNSSIDEASTLMVREALGNFAGDNITAVMIKVEETDTIIGTIGTTIPPEKRETPMKNVAPRISRAESQPRKKRIDYSRLISSLVFLAVAVAVVFGAFTMWKSLKEKTSERAEPTTTAASTTENTQTNTQGTVTAPVASTTTPAEGEIPSAPVTPAPSETEKVHVVVSGDTLSGISQKYYGTPNKYNLIIEANKLTSENITIGQKLVIPAAQ